MGLYDSKTSNSSDSEFSQNQKIAIAVIILIALFIVGFIGGGYFVYESKQRPSNDSNALIEDSKVAYDKELKEANERVDELIKQKELKNNTIQKDSSITDKNFEKNYLAVDEEFKIKIKDSNKVMVLKFALMTTSGESIFYNFKKNKVAIISSVMDVIRQPTEAETKHPNFRKELASKIHVVINNELIKYNSTRGIWNPDKGIDEVFFTSFVIQ
jgi:flagellar basal body-associated protein FliL